MTARLGVREIVRNFGILDQYDYVEIEDKKTHQYKGLFVSAEIANDVKEYIEKKLQEEKRRKLSKMLSFAGSASGSATNMSEKEMRMAHAKSKLK